MILLDILTTRAALALADSECADWLTRPCGEAIPDEDASGCDPKRFRGRGEVSFVNHVEGK